MKKRIEFTLHTSAPSTVGHPSPNRDWHVVESVPEERIKALGIPRTFYHCWNDGWSAAVFTRIMKKGEHRRKSAGAGFCGYEWMVRNILRWGHTACLCNKGDETAWKPYVWQGYEDKGPHERCKWCRATRKVRTPTTTT